MTQPRDPIAFSRFIDGLGSSGDPDFDPRARVEADSVAAEAASAGEAPAALTETPAAAEDAAAEDAAAENAVAETPRPAVETPPWAGEAGGAETAAPTETSGENAGTAIVETGEAGPVIAETPETVGLPAAPPAEISTKTPLDLPAEPPVEPPAEIPAAPDWDGAELVLVPAEERPPKDSAEFHEPIPPEISFSELPRESYSGTMDSRFFVDPLEPPAEIPIENSAPVPEISPPGALAREKFAREEFAPPVFSAPLISRLEQGKYYVQLGAYSKAELVEAELRRIGAAYPVAVQNGGSSERPLYRILLGPVNLGESGAILQRFKGSGYGDAFVRRGS
jgi:hypothetical protein